MSATTVLVQGIKARLRAQGLSYRDLADRLGVSEPTVKRDLSRGTFSLERLDRICEVLGVEVTDLAQPTQATSLTELSEQQERALVDSPKLLLLTYLIVNEWKVAEIVATFRLDENDVVSLLLKLDRLRIIDFRPPAGIRRLTARNFSWRKDGPVHEFFIRRVIPEFFNARFDDAGDDLRFMGGTLTPTSMLRLRSSMQRVAAEFEQLAQQDARLPLDERDGCTAIFALRTWEFSEFAKLRRAPRARRTAARLSRQ